MEAINKKELFKNAWVAARNAVYNNRCGKPQKGSFASTNTRWSVRLKSNGNGNAI